ncbi:hypothetical protein GGF32_002695 [Allomyces javanicus]|nr:hypothetical protein GGF32_002695 [Allomyces javanicus]
MPLLPLSSSSGPAAHAKPPSSGPPRGTRGRRHRKPTTAAPTTQAPITLTECRLDAAEYLYKQTESMARMYEQQGAERAKMERLKEHALAERARMEAKIAQDRELRAAAERARTESMKSARNKQTGASNFSLSGGYDYESFDDEHYGGDFSVEVAYDEDAADDEYYGSDYSVAEDAAFEGDDMREDIFSLEDAYDEELEDAADYEY